jgi:glycosyltransferase involved in cell wall biosynthesis
MRVKIISCWFATSYGAYTDGLRRGLERRLANEVGIVATNCGCGDPVAERHEFQDARCEYFERPNLKHFKSTSPIKYWLRTQTRQLVYWDRARQFHRRDGDADVVHFQQILNATGAMTLFHWLKQPTRAARVVTVHELDPYQVDFAASNRSYNLADRIIVHCLEMKESLVERGVDEARIDVVPHGVELHTFPEEPRDAIVFYGGHKLHSNKGFDTLVRALGIVKRQLGERTPRLKVHGHWGDETPELGRKAVREAGLDGAIEWMNQLKLERATVEYRRARLCVLPYTGSFGGYAAGLAMANGAPVIATSRAGLPDHLGDAARYIEPGDPDALATAIVELLSHDAARKELVARARARAEAVLGWDTIAGKTLDAYRRAIDARRGVAGHQSLHETDASDGVFVDARRLRRR